MKKIIFLVSIFFLVFLKKSHSLDEKILQKLLAGEYERTASFLCFLQNQAEWNFETDMNNKEKEKKLLNVTVTASKIEKQYWIKYFKDTNLETLNDLKLRRQVDHLKVIGHAALDKKKLSELTSVIDNMTNIYGTAKVCPFDNQNCNLSKDGLPLEPDIEAVFAKSTNFDELRYYWTSWRDATGLKMKELYATYVNLSNEAAIANNFKDKGEMWLHSYESASFVDDIDELWQQVEPLYTELHRYVGKKLKKLFGDKIDISDGLIPANVFGNMWAQEWNNIGDLVRPYPNATKINIDEALLKQNYTVLQMFKTSDDFFKSMGLLSNEMSYDTSKGAMIVKPTDGREVLCHASSWDFCNKKTYRIKMCTNVNQEDFITIHHEMGHIQYFLQYAKQPYSFRDGANPGFHEAIGDTIALSVATPQHLLKLKLLENYNATDESSINYLMDIALQKIAFLPFGLLIDKWRWEVFSGNVSEDQFNVLWWEYRKKYQKVKPPVERSNRDFDPGAKYHVVGDSEYIAYFVAHILQFQFYKSLCIAAGEYNPVAKTAPLHKCDFYQSASAGKLLSNALSAGSSQPWSQTLKSLTGEEKMNAGALLEYFDPLYQFLKQQNSK